MLNIVAAQIPIVQWWEEELCVLTLLSNVAFLHQGQQTPSIVTIITTVGTWW